MSKRRYILLILLAVVSVFVHNTALPPDIMECRNLVTAREIAHSECDWLLPTMNGELRLEKPPLPTWIAASIEVQFPDNLVCQRIPPALMTLWCAFFLFLFVRRITNEEVAFFTLLVFFTFYQVVLMSRTASWDVYCHAFMMSAVYLLYVLLTAKLSHSKQLLYAISLGLCLGLSFLSKGLVSFYVLLLPSLIALHLLRNSLEKGRAPLLILSLCVAIVVGGWWYAYLYIVHPNELYAVFHKETAAWVGRNVRPWWYYWRFWLEAGVWCPFVLWGLMGKYWKPRLTFARPYAFIFAMLLLQLLFLSLMPEKKYRYLYPTMLTMAPLTGLLLHHFIERGMLWLRYIIGGVVAVFVILVVFFLPSIGRTFSGTSDHTLALLQDDHRTHQLPYYYAEKEELRIECVYNAGHRITPLALNDETEVRKAIPCVLLLQTATADSLIRQLPSFVKSVYVGKFDDNHHAPTDSHYNPAMLHKAYILTIDH